MGGRAGRTRSAAQVAMHFKRVEASLDVSLHPAELKDASAAVAGKLDGLLMRYKPQLGGVVLAYSGAKAAVRDAPAVLPYVPHVVLDVSATLTVFSPRVGECVHGVVTAVGSELISLLVSGIKAVVRADELRAISADDQAGGDKWSYDPARRVWYCASDSERSICEGCEVRFVVRGIQDLRDDLLEEVEVLGALRHSEESLDADAALGRVGGAHARDAPKCAPTTPLASLATRGIAAKSPLMSPGGTGGGSANVARKRVSFAALPPGGVSMPNGVAKITPLRSSSGGGGGGSTFGKPQGSGGDASDGDGGGKKRKRSGSEGSDGGEQNGGAGGAGGDGGEGTPGTSNAEKQKSKKKKYKDKKKRKARERKEGGGAGGGETPATPATPAAAANGSAAAANNGSAAAANGSAAGQTPEEMRRKMIEALQSQIDSLKAQTTPTSATPGKSGGKKKKKKKYKGGKGAGK